jgi:hypothetical protein
MCKSSTSGGDPKVSQAALRKFLNSWLRHSAGSGPPNAIAPLSTA